MALSDCFVVLFFVSVTVGQQSAPDAGFESFVSTFSDAVDACPLEPSAPLPEFLTGGSFVFPTASQFEMGPYALQHAFDGFGRLLRFDFNGSTLCLTSRLMGSSVYNQSLESSKIAPSLLFRPTHPPSGYSGPACLNGANDNNNVNSVVTGGELRMLTDSETPVHVDPASFVVLNKVNWTDGIDGHGFGRLIGLSSAHPVEDVANPGCYINVQPMQDLEGLTHKIDVIRVCDKAPNTRVVVNTVKTSFLPYFHAFGVTARFVVLPLMPFTIDFVQIATRGLSMIEAMRPAGGDSMEVLLVPLDGSDALTFKFDTPFFYSHVVNAYEDESGNPSIDLCRYDDNWFLRFDFDVLRNKSARDTRFLTSVITRYTFNLADKSVKTQALSAPTRYTDMPQYNRAHTSAPYCLYWAIEWFHDDATYGAMGLVRQNVCNASAERLYWYEYGHFPSQPSFVSRPEASAEDDGVLLFTSLDGATNRSYFWVVDASDMTTLSTTEIPMRMTFGLHGEFYGPGVLPA